jgi:DNA-binding CsgD family transcriptional regulator
MGGKSRESVFEETENAVRFATDVASALVAFRASYEEVAHVTYHHAQTITIPEIDTPYVRTTYPESWVARYLLKDYVKIDPVLREGITRSFPFDWSEINIDEKAMELFKDFQDHGLGLNGYSVPITDKIKRRAVLSINAKTNTQNWYDHVQLNRNDWLNLAHTIHRKAIIELYGEQDPVPQLSPREIEILYWVSKGKEAKEIAKILKISEHTVRSYMRSVRFKLDCTNLSQAVAKAAALHLI